MWCIDFPVVSGLSLSARLVGISPKTVVRIFTIEIDLTEAGWRRMFFIACVYLETRGSANEPGDEKSTVPPIRRS
jgi:hypothetical protein